MLDFLRRRSFDAAPKFDPNSLREPQPAVPPVQPRATNRRSVKKTSFHAAVRDLPDRANLERLVRRAYFNAAARREVLVELDAHYCSEGFRFLGAVFEREDCGNAADLRTHFSTIIKTYVVQDAPHQVNLPSAVQKSLLNLPRESHALPHVLNAAKREVLLDLQCNRAFMLLLEEL